MQIGSLRRAMRVAGCHPQVMFNAFFYKARVEYKGSYKEYVNKWGITFLPESN